MPLGIGDGTCTFWLGIDIGTDEGFARRIIEYVATVVVLLSYCCAEGE